MLVECVIVCGIKLYKIKITEYSNFVLSSALLRK